MKHLILFFFLLTPAIGFSLEFGQLEQISPNGGNGVPPLLAVAENGNALAAWLHFPFSIQAATFSIAHPPAWSPAVTLTDEGSSPIIGVDQLGNGFIVWVSLGVNHSSTQIAVSRFDVATHAFSPAQIISNHPASQNSSPKLAVSAGGSAVVSWMQSTPLQFLSSSFNPLTGVWSPPVPTAFLPASIGLDSLGHGFAIIDSFNSIPENNFNDVQGSIQVSRMVVP